VRSLDEARHGNGRGTEPYLVIGCGYVAGESRQPWHLICTDAREGMSDKINIQQGNPFGCPFQELHLHGIGGTRLAGGFLLPCAWAYRGVVHRCAPCIP
jgi:hypothetical protein